MAEVVARFMGTDQIDVQIWGNTSFNTSHTFATADDWLTEVANARVWAGLHYRFSTVAGVHLGKEVADYDLDHAFSNGD
jgi:hypothetical protein